MRSLWPVIIGHVTTMQSFGIDLSILSTVAGKLGHYVKFPFNV
jgi:hypothetical protein